MDERRANGSWIAPGEGSGKATAWNPKETASTAVGKPTRATGFSIPHSLDGGPPSPLNGEKSRATQTGHFIFLSTYFSINRKEFEQHGVGPIGRLSL
jgi:hypothetical protein